MARPSKYEGERTAVLVRGYAMDGCTNEQIAERLGVTRKTLQEWAAKHTDISDALKQGKVRTDFEVESALLKKAKSGDVTACIFWLKNRRPDKWRDRPKDEQLGLDDPIRQLLQVITEGRKAAA
jgi:transcriptional regulator with XRE-family HTH domain